MLAAFAGLTLAAGLAALYLWHERGLKRREADDPALAFASLVSLEASARTVAVSLRC